jgi:FMN phosphatase YigB (HAD superfamily)
MTTVEYVFIDNGGVMTDNSRRAPHYRRLVGEYFVPRYGGTQASWEAANTDTFPRAWERFLARVAGWNEDGDLVRATWLYNADWLRFLFAGMGLTPPDDDDECAAIGHAAERWINPQIVTLFPGVEDTVRSLASRYRLFTASDGFSGPLSETLAPIAHVFERLYGPDYVNVPKSSGRRYYDAIFAHAEVDPARALVLDDNISNVAAAQEAGARAVYVASQPPAGYDGARIALLADLPAIIEAL